MFNQNTKDILKGLRDPDWRMPMAQCACNCHVSKIFSNCNGNPCVSCGALKGGWERKFRLDLITLPSFHSQDCEVSRCNCEDEIIELVSQTIQEEIRRHDEELAEKLEDKRGSIVFGPYGTLAEITAYNQGLKAAQNLLLNK